MVAHLGVEGNAGAEGAVNVQPGAQHVAHAFLRRARVVVVLIRLRVAIAVRRDVCRNRTRSANTARGKAWRRDAHSPRTPSPAGRPG